MTLAPPKVDSCGPQVSVLHQPGGNPAVRFMDHQQQVESDAREPSSCTLPYQTSPLCDGETRKAFVPSERVSVLFSTTPLSVLRGGLVCARLSS